MGGEEGVSERGERREDGRTWGKEGKMGERERRISERGGEGVIVCGEAEGMSERGG